MNKHRTHFTASTFLKAGAHLRDVAGRQYRVSDALEAGQRQRCFVYLIPPLGERPRIGAAASETIRFALDDGRFGDQVVATAVVRECWPRTRGQRCRTGVVLVDDWRWHDSTPFTESDILPEGAPAGYDAAPPSRSRPP